MRIPSWLAKSTMILALPLLAACGGDDSYVTVRASDASALRQALGEVSIDDYDSIELNVVAVRLRIHGTDDSKKSKDGPWYDLALARIPPQQQLGQPQGRDWEPGRPYILDLVRLLKGGDFILAEGEVPAGTLTQIRFVLDSKQAGWAYPVGSMRSESRRVPLVVPSGAQSGLKLTGGKFNLEPSEDHTIQLQFDSRASIREHNGGALRIRPVIKLKGTGTVMIDVDD